MKRGEPIAVLSLLGIVGILALTGLVLTPQGMVAQGDSIYPQADSFALGCRSGAIMLIDRPTSTTYCCKEDMIGPNTCRVPHTVIKAR